ncbi:cell division protein FtsL [uncultured Ellagibacter sp.]|uniref:cell division protein FtsL n=1 Tax=uncultured Ellagibacter sp. TaxID=2137580 RepID=UPI002620FE89|nr:cell division protein FtsL [uncultured Ellagibacter sp.]
MSAVPAYSRTAERVPERYPARPRISVVPGGKTQVETLSPAIVTLAKAVAIVLVALAVVAFARIALTAAAVNVEVESKSYDSLIDTARSEGSSLEVAQSSLSNPSRIKAEATALGMSAPESSSKIIMPEDIVVTDGSGNISLSQSLAAAARS